MEENNDRMLALVSQMRTTKTMLKAMTLEDDNERYLQLFRRLVALEVERQGLLRGDRER